MQKRNVVLRDNDGGVFAPHVRHGGRIYILPVDRHSWPEQVYIDVIQGCGADVYTSRLMTSYAGKAYPLPKSA